VLAWFRIVRCTVVRNLAFRSSDSRGMIRSVRPSVRKSTSVSIVISSMSRIALSKTESCQSVHTGYCISGRMTVRMDNGDEFTVGPGDAFHMPAGHDAWTVGDEECVLIDTSGVKAYAKK
jgi:mannose-6-phosphate isomerase-like protein (cupin superfamily)